MDSPKVHLEITGEKLLELLSKIGKIEEDIKDIKVSLSSNLDCMQKCVFMQENINSLSVNVDGLSKKIETIENEKKDFVKWLKRTIIAGILALSMTAIGALIYKGIRYDREKQFEELQNPQTNRRQLTGRR